MKVAFVSTYPPRRCAIGIYTQKLARALLDVAPEAAVHVIAERGADVAHEERLDTAPTYSRGEDYRDAIVDAATRARCDVVHAQYAPDLFGEDDRLPALLEAIRSRGIGTVVTLHTVYDARLTRRLTFKKSTRWFHRAVAKHADKIIVHHEEGMATKLVEQGVSRHRIEVIPHGTTLMPLPDRDAGRDALGIPRDRTLLTFFGFIHRYKNVHTVTEGFLRAAHDVPNAMLLVAGSPWGDRWYNRLYLNVIKARVRAAGMSSRVRFMDEYIPDARVPQIYAATDVILLPHQQAYGSASGVFHQAVGTGRPALIARGPKFQDAENLFSAIPEVFVHPNSPRQWARAIARMGGDAKLREAVCSAMVDYARRTEWRQVARQHAAVYRDLS